MAKEGLNRSPSQNHCSKSLHDFSEELHEAFVILALCSRLAIYGSESSRMKIPEDWFARYF
jgi:hypothetical protein